MGTPEDARFSELRLGHKKVTREHSPVDGDYLEVIYELIGTKGYARVVDIAHLLNASPATVTKRIQRLHEDGLLTYERYRGVTLTPKGGASAKRIKEKHDILIKFLRLLGVEEQIARIDVCSTGGLEHHLHDETVRAIEHFVSLATEEPHWLERLRQSHLPSPSRAPPV